MPIPLIAALVLSLVVGGGAALGSQSSLPSDNLFGVKLFTEDVRLAVASGENEDESSASRSAQGKIGAAENKIAETERNLERKGRKMEERSLNDSRDELDEARNLLDSAKKE